MARYIDADALLSRLPDDLHYKASVKRVLIQAPEADVVPKSEVAREIFEEIEKTTFSFGFGVRGDRTVAHTRTIDDDLLFELKKKYTEDADEK